MAPQANLLQPKAYSPVTLHFNFAMKLSETSHAHTWLEQFEIDDQSAAASLLDAIRFAPGGDVVSGVRATVENYLSQHPQRTPVAMVPVISLEDMFHVKGYENKDKRTVFKGFDPAQPIANQPGSEALIAQLISEMARSPSGQLIASVPHTLDGLKRSAVRTILCVTDYIGSGQQVNKYVDSWCRHPSIRSWRSFGWIKISIIAYAATAAGKRNVESNPYIDSLEVVEIAPSIAEAKTSLNGLNIEEICRIYANRGKLGRPLGFKGSAGLFASSFSVPNNLPAILIRDSPTWKPFFSGRSATAELSTEIGDVHPQLDIHAQLERAGQVALSDRYRNGDIDYRWINHLLVLAMLPKTEEDMALALGENLSVVQDIRRTLTKLLLVDADGRVTASGRRALLSHGKKRRRSSAGLDPDPSPYYPRHMR